VALLTTTGVTSPGTGAGRKRGKSQGGVTVKPGGRGVSGGAPGVGVARLTCHGRRGRAAAACSATPRRRSIKLGRDTRHDGSISERIPHTQVPYATQPNARNRAAGESGAMGNRCDPDGINGTGHW